MQTIPIKCAHTGKMAISELKKRFHPRNRNTHPPSQIDYFRKIFRAQGIRQAAVISNFSGNLVTSHGRIIAADLEGMIDYPVDEQDFDSEEQEYLHLVADNATAQQSILDFVAINKDLEYFGPIDVDLLGIKDFLAVPEDKNEKGKDEKSKKEIECPECGFAFAK